ncbi:MAG: MMPL family transporter [bacterium]|nr:MMPL family transporter [bacterium]
MERIIRFISGHPWIVISLAVLVTGFSLTRFYDPYEGRLLVGYDPSTNRLLPEGDPGREFYEHTRVVFGSDETILVVLHADDLFTRQNLETLRILTEKLDQVEGVHHVTSLVTAQSIRGDAEGLLVEPLFYEVPEDPEHIAELRRQALDNPIFAGNLISKDATTAAIQVHFLDFDDADFFERGIDAEIARIAHENKGNTEVWITGAPHIKVANQITQRAELQRNVPLILVILGVVLAFSFRSLRGVLLPLVTVVVALIWTMGVAGAAGRPLNQVTVLVPLLILILGLSYSVHVVSEFFDEVREDPESSAAESMRRALMKVWLPVSLTGLTTAVGFLSVLLTPIAAIREFGAFSLTGVIGSVVASLTITPALLIALGKPRALTRAREEDAREDLFSRFAGIVAEVVLSRRRQVFFAFGLVFIGSIIATTQMRVSSDSIKSLAADLPARTDFEAINEHLDGATAFNVVIDASYVDAFKDPKNVREVEKLAQWLRKHPDIGGTTSLVDFVKIMNRGFNEDNPEYFAIPESKRMLSQLMFFGASDDMERFVDSRYQLVNIVLRTPLVDAADLRVLSGEIEKRLKLLPEHMSATVTGNAIVMQRMIDDLIRGQVMTVGGALIVIYVILSLLFLSPMNGFIALIPNIVPVIAYFGALGLTGIPLSITTSIVAPMALGIAIDDTIHYFARFTEDAKRLADEKRATRHALRTVGRPVTYTTISVVLGFLVLTQSDLLNQVHVGLMGAFTLAIAWLVDFTLTPALCSGLRVVTLWDTLRLDLGDAPQQTIPLFRGLSTAQCRILAQMASMRRVPSGQPLLRSGDEGQEMYLIIDGTLEISIDGQEGRIVLAQSTRGDLVGEVGFYTRRRTADVEVLEDARLLRLTQGSLERISKRRPRLAARVFSNMNSILADRVSNTTDHLR